MSMMAAAPLTPAPTRNRPLRVPRVFQGIGAVLGSLALMMGLALAEVGFTHFEARHCHPVTQTPDGQLLLAVNSPEGRLSVFSTAPGMSLPRLIAEIPVGMEPVTVRARTSEEAWVINEVSDSVSIVDLVSRQAVATLLVGDEPADLVFSHGKAYVTCARENRIAVIDVASRSVVSSISLQGNFPRSLALSPDGRRLFVAFLFSGNRTTSLHFRKAPAQPAPTNPALPAAPQVALIVPDSDPRIPYQVIDHDVAEIDLETQVVLGYRPAIGTNIHALACAPDGMLWAAATEARNLIRFEPNLNGVFQESRVARIHGGLLEIRDLNPHAESSELAESGKSLSLAQPMAVLADADGAWVAAFGSDRVARLGNSGEILERVDLRGAATTRVRGPRGLARHPVSGNISVFNKLSSTLSILSSSGSFLGEIPLASHQPIPLDHQQGRGFFYDSRISGNGTVSCGSCHFDADIDGVAWDLGSPGGVMQTVSGSSPSIGEPDPVDRLMHPMKGPMVTQPLRGIKGAGPFHWRGDIATIQGFNSNFSNLQASQPLPAADMDKVAAYIESLRNHPNPNRLSDNSLPVALNGGNPIQGKMRFEQLNVCSKCHSGPRGTNHIIDEFTSVLTLQPVKNATLEHVYKKLAFTPDQNTTLSGYGFNHDGTGHDIPRGHEYSQDRFHLYPNSEVDVMAFILCTETGTSPSVGLTTSQPSTLLEAQALLGRCDLVAHAMIRGERRSFLYQPALGLYQADSAAGADLTRGELAGLADSLLFIGVPPGNGTLLSIDRDGDGIRNRDVPAPALSVDSFLQPLSQPERVDWYPEVSRDLKTWQPAPTHSPVVEKQFFRLHRTW